MYKNIVSYTIILFALLAIIGCNGERKNTHISPFGVISAAPKDNSNDVYVCTGRYAKRFHCDEDCKGLRSCRGDIVVMSIEEAEDYGLTPCGYCY
jgi:hypothetical protein